MRGASLFSRSGRNACETSHGPSVFVRNVFSKISDVMVSAASSPSAMMPALFHEEIEAVGVTREFLDCAADARCIRDVDLDQCDAAVRAESVRRHATGFDVARSEKNAEVLPRQLPRRLAHLLTAAGHDAVHTLDVPGGNRTRIASFVRFVSATIGCW